LGVQLIQEQADGTFRPIGFWSRQCLPAEQNYSPTEREALAIVWGVKICRPYLERTKFVVRSDHQALKWLFSTSATDGNPRIVRWKLALSAYDFTVEYKPGVSHKVPDELSRMFTDGHTTLCESDIDDIPCLVVDMEECELPSIPVLPREGPLLRVPQPFEAISNDELFREQRSDPWCGDLLDQISLKRPDTRPAGLFVDDDGLICCRS
jgi:RNase H-like domain found in reverse transcriptase